MDEFFKYQRNCILVPAFNLHWNKHFLHQAARYARFGTLASRYSWCVNLQLNCRHPGPISGDLSLCCPLEMLLTWRITWLGLKSLALQSLHIEIVSSSQIFPGHLNNISPAGTLHGSTLGNRPTLGELSLEGLEPSDIGALRFPNWWAPASSGSSSAAYTQIPLAPAAAGPLGALGAWARSKLGKSLTWHTSFIPRCEPWCMAYLPTKLGHLWAKCWWMFHTWSIWDLALHHWELINSPWMAPWIPWPFACGDA